MTGLDIIIILLLLLGAVLGYKKGFLRTTVEFLGCFAVIIIAFFVKNFLSILLYQNLPFFNLGGIAILNILLYEAIAFLGCFLALIILFYIALFAAKIFEKIAQATVLNVPAKVGGTVIGFLQAYLYLFVFLYVMSTPMFHNSMITDSKIKGWMLTKTPILSNSIDKAMLVLDELKDLKDMFIHEPGNKELNNIALNSFLKYNIVSVDSIDLLIKKGKLKVENADEILSRYRR